MSTLVRKSVVGALAGLCFHVPMQAQEAPPQARAFLSAGGGLGSHGTFYAAASLSHRTGDYILRGALAFDLGVGFAVGGVEWTKELAEGALLYGRRARTNWGWARGALGVGYIHSEQLAPVSPGEEPSTAAYGLAAQAGVVWAPRSWLGVGVTGVGNLNELRSLGALTLSMHLGRIRQGPFVLLGELCRCIATSEWHRTPEGAWSIYNDGPGPRGSGSAEE